MPQRLMLASYRRYKHCCWALQSGAEKLSSIGLSIRR